MANLAALRAAVFSLSAKNLRGADNRPPAVRGLKHRFEILLTYSLAIDIKHMGICVVGVTRAAISVT